MLATEPDGNPLVVGEPRVLAYGFIVRYPIMIAKIRVFLLLYPLFPQETRELRPGIEEDVTRTEVTSQKVNEPGQPLGREW